MCGSTLKAQLTLRQLSSWQVVLEHLALEMGGVGIEGCSETLPAVVHRGVG